MPSADNAVIQRRILLAHSGNHDKDVWGQINFRQITPCAVAAVLLIPKMGPGTELFPSTVVLTFGCLSGLSGEV